MKSIGTLTIGQAPRADDLVTEIAATLGPGYRVIQRGALDGLDAKDIAALSPGPQDYVLVTLLRDGTSVTLGKPRLLPLVQRQIEALEGDGVDATLLLCTGEFPRFHARRPVIRPQEALYGLVRGLAGAGGRIGVFTPLPAQVEQARRKWAAMGVDPTIVSASPYTGKDEVAPAAQELAAAGVDVAFLDCFGYSLGMKRAAAAALGRPVVLARSAIARVMAEIVD
ncbi:MAG TPA: AroM family protein [Bacillota bacterium]|nr:AroM family protein [Bacillota bacterium]